MGLLSIGICESGRLSSFLMASVSMLARGTVERPADEQKRLIFSHTIPASAAIIRVARSPDIWKRSPLATSSSVTGAWVTKSWPPHNMER